MASFPDGTSHVVDPNRADVEVGHPNAWAGNMRHALVGADGADIHRGPQWRVERFISRRRALAPAAGEADTGDEAGDIVDCVPPYADGMLRGLRFDINQPIAATFIHDTDGRVFHAVYHVAAPYRGVRRVEVYGVLLAAVPAAAPYETWLPATSLRESWQRTAPAVVDVCAALVAPSHL